MYCPGCQSQPDFTLKYCEGINGVAVEHLGALNGGLIMGTLGTCISPSLSSTIVWGGRITTTVGHVTTTIEKRLRVIIKGTGDALTCFPYCLALEYQHTVTVQQWFKEGPGTDPFFCQGPSCYDRATQSAQYVSVWNGLDDVATFITRTMGLTYLSWKCAPIPTCLGLGFDPCPNPDSGPLYSSFHDYYETNSCGDPTAFPAHNITHPIKGCWVTQQGCCPENGEYITDLGDAPWADMPLTIKPA